MTTSRIFSPRGRFVGATLLALSLVVMPFGAAATPLDQASAALAGPSRQSPLVGFWSAILELFADQAREAAPQEDGVQAKCGVIPDPSGICKQAPPTASPVIERAMARGPAKS